MQIYRVVREKKQRFEVIRGVYGIFHREFGECSARFQRPCPGRVFVQSVCTNSLLENTSTGTILKTRQFQLRSSVVLTQWIDSKVVLIAVRPGHPPKLKLGLTKTQYSLTVASQCCITMCITPATQVIERNWNTCRTGEGGPEIFTIQLYTYSSFSREHALWRAVHDDHTPVYPGNTPRRMYSLQSDIRRRARTHAVQDSTRVHAITNNAT
eukprot:COSAG02_NODE_1173_length_14105_cov_15.197701_2_plen_211_part_00